MYLRKDHILFESKTKITATRVEKNATIYQRLKQESVKYYFSAAPIKIASSIRRDFESNIFRTTKTTSLSNIFSSKEHLQFVLETITV
jgi:hypothetical protein